MVVEGARLAIVMDYVAGGSLRDAVKEAGPLRPVDALTRRRRGVRRTGLRPLTRRDAPRHSSRTMCSSPAPGPSAARATCGSPTSASPTSWARRSGRRPAHRHARSTCLPSSSARAGPALRAMCTQRASCSTSSSPGALRLPGRGRTSASRTAMSPHARRGSPWTTQYGTSRLRCCPKILPSARRHVRPRRRSGVSRPALPAAPDRARTDAPADFDAVERPATVVRGAFTDEDLTAFASAPPADHAGKAPELGEADSATIARPIPRREVRPRAEARLEEKVATPFWRTRKALLLAGTAALLARRDGRWVRCPRPSGQQMRPTAAGGQCPCNSGRGAARPA